MTNSVRWWAALEEGLRVDMSRLPTAGHLCVWQKTRAASIPRPARRGSGMPGHGSPDTKKGSHIRKLAALGYTVTLT